MGENANTLVQQLIGLQRIDHAFEHWSGYRKELTDFILRHTEQNTSAMILGAGACNDFDLAQLSGHFSELILADHRLDAMQEGLKRQLTDESNVRLLETDLLGVPIEAYESMSDAVLRVIQTEKTGQGSNPKRVEEIILSRMEAALQNRTPDRLILGEDTVDYTICCGVHSQLIALFPQIAGFFRKYAEFDLNQVLSAASAWNAKIAMELNMRIIRLSRRGFVLGLEETRIGMAGGVEGAAQALSDLKNRSLPLIAEKDLVWPFDPFQDKAYHMKLLALRTDRTK